MFVTDPKLEYLIQLDELEKIIQSWEDVKEKYELKQNLVKINYTNTERIVFTVIRKHMRINGRKIRDSTVRKFAVFVWRVLKNFREKTKILYLSQKRYEEIAEWLVSILIREHITKRKR